MTLSNFLTENFYSYIIVGIDNVKSLQIRGRTSFGDNHSFGPTLWSINELKSELIRNQIPESSHYEIAKTLFEMSGFTCDYQSVKNFISDHFHVADVSHQPYSRYFHCRLHPKDEIGFLCLEHSDPKKYDDIQGVCVVLNKYFNIYIPYEVLGFMVLDLFDNHE